MRTVLAALILVMIIGSADAAVNLAVSQQGGANVREAAGRVAGQLSRELGTVISVVELADNAELESWLNRFATAELAVVESAYVAGKPGQFVMIGPVGRDLMLVGRQGISGDLPQRAATVLGTGATQPAIREAAAPARPAPRIAEPQPERTGVVAAPVAPANSSKSSSEDRYFVIHTYREKFGRDPEPDRLDYWTQQLQSGVLSKQQFYEQICRDGMALCIVER